ncbi:hypothetical protein ABZ484_24010, partial [Streptomyces sp. NPDC006393]|uniref:hypothetical protein n=1 Tax=Streptomyces sp. NPDC006393 TaxID=3156763 RepID=UPI0033C00674
FPSVFPTLSDLFRPDFLGAFQVPALAFPFPAIPTLSELSRRSDRPSLPIHREGFSEIDVSKKQADVHCGPVDWVHLRATV